MTIEISDLAAADTFVVELITPNGAPLLDAEGRPASITVYGPGSKAYAAAQAANTQRILERAAKSGDSIKMSPEEQASDAAQFLAACTAGISGWAYKGATDKAAITAVYADPKFGWLTKQVDRAIGNWANFMPGSAIS